MEPMCRAGTKVQRPPEADERPLRQPVVLLREQVVSKRRNNARSA